MSQVGSQFCAIGADSTRSPEGIAGEVAGRQPGPESIGFADQPGLLAGLVVHHEQFVGAPVLAEILPIVAEGQGLEETVLTVVVVDAPEPVLRLAVPGDETGVARPLVGGRRSTTKQSVLPRGSSRSHL